VTEIEKASAAAVEAARQSDQYVALLAAVSAEAATRQQAPPVIHVHQAPPDRTLQRLAYGAGTGAGATAAAVYFGPLLVASLTAMVWLLTAGALGVAVLGWAVVHVTGAVRPEPARGRRKR
jgi:hypothetical protein